MASTEHLAAILARCQAVGAKLLLVGDPSQLGAVGPGGAFIDLAERGIRYELADVRRFTQRSGSAPPRFGCATATRACSPSTPSTAACATAAPPSRPRPPRPARGWPTRWPGGSRC